MEKLEFNQVIYLDPYNPDKTYEVTRLEKGSYYLKELIDGKQLLGKGGIRTRKQLEDLGIFDMKIFHSIVEVNLCDKEEE